jgi:spermidine synthase
LSLPIVEQAELDVRPLAVAPAHARFLNPGELEVLVALIAGAGARRVVEFGANDGRTAKAVLDNVATIERYTGVDVPAHHVPTLAWQRREVPKVAGALAAADPRFELIVRPRGSFDLTAADFSGRTVDAVFVDGDHGWRGVLNDTLLAGNIVRQGGLIIWHDYHDRGQVDVREVLETMLRHGAPIRCVARTWIAFVRVP